MSPTSKYVYITSLLIFFFLEPPAFSWNAVGHELVVQVAYDQLTPTEKKFWENRLAGLQAVYPKENFVRASTLPDELRKHGINAFGTWHFIDLPIFLNNQKFHYDIDTQNIIWALDQSIQVQKSPYANKFEKAFFASFLIHLVADAHQPLHCSSLYTVNFPQGDRGGNLFKIKNYRWHNLHSYWDQGGGYLTYTLIKNKTALQETAQALETQYPPSYFGKRTKILNQKIWVHESHDMAASIVYTLPEHSAPSTAYQQQTEKITQEQIVLAGYRLGLLLQSLFPEK